MRGSTLLTMGTSRGSIATMSRCEGSGQAILSTLSATKPWCWMILVAFCPRGGDAVLARCLLLASLAKDSGPACPRADCASSQLKSPTTKSRKDSGRSTSGEPCGNAARKRLLEDPDFPPDVLLAERRQGIGHALELVIKQLGESFTMDGQHIPRGSRVGFAAKLDARTVEELNRIQSSLARRVEGQVLGQVREPRLAGGIAGATRGNHPADADHRGLWIPFQKDAHTARQRGPRGFERRELRLKGPAGGDWPLPRRKTPHRGKRDGQHQGQ